MVVDVIIPVYRPEREKLTKLIDWLNKQTVKPSHVFFMQTLVEEKEDEEVLQMLQKAENVEIVPIEKKDFDHGGTRNKGAALSKADYMLFMTQDTPTPILAKSMSRSIFDISIESFTCIWFSCR